VTRVAEAEKKNEIEEPRPMPMQNKGATLVSADIGNNGEEPFTQGKESTVGVDPSTQGEESTVGEKEASTLFKLSPSVGTWMLARPIERR